MIVEGVPTGTPFEIRQAYAFTRQHLASARMAFEDGDCLAALVFLQNAHMTRHFARALRRWAETTRRMP